MDQPGAITDYDWRKFQIEYRDYIDLAKMAQLIPVVGAPIGAVVKLAAGRSAGRDGDDGLPDAVAGRGGCPDAALT